jgi:hypothetical protein
MLAGGKGWYGICPKDDNPIRTLKAGDTFYEPTGCLHRPCQQLSTERFSGWAPRWRV